MNDGTTKTHYVQVMCRKNPNKACGISYGTDDQYCSDCPMNTYDKPYYEGTSAWQICPLCLGQGRVNSYGVTTNLFETCPVCDGKKIISKITGRPPF